MDFSFSEEQELIRVTAKEFSEKRLAPIAFQIDHENQVPNNIFQELGELDLIGLPFQESFGGTGAGYLSHVMAQEYIARGSSGVGMCLSVNTLGLSAINNHGNEKQKLRWITDCCKGLKLASFAFTEPDTGSDPKMLSTTLKRKDNHFILNGSKRFISLSDYPGPMVVFAADEEVGRPTAVIIDKLCPGYELGENWEKIGLRGCHAYDVFFKDIRIDEDQILGERGKGFDILLENIAYGKLGFCAESLGHCTEALEQSILYAKTKTNRDKPISRFESMQLRLADMATKLEAIRWITYHLGYEADHRKSPLGSGLIN